MSPHATLVGHTALVHRALERLFERVAAADVDDETRRVGAEAAAVALRAHHLMEDELLLPLLREKGAEGPWEQLAHDHEGFAAGAPDPVLLREHFAREEQVWTEAFWRELLTEEEAAALGKQVAVHARAHLKPTAVQLPLLLYNLDDDERARFTERMPAFVVRGLVPYLYRASWRPLRPFMAFAPRRMLSS